MGAERRKMHEGNCGENEEYPSVRDGCNDQVGDEGSGYSEDGSACRRDSGRIRNPLDKADFLRYHNDTANANIV